MPKTIREKTKVVNFRLKEEDKKALDEISAKLGIKPARLINHALKSVLDLLSDVLDVKKEP